MATHSLGKVSPGENTAQCSGASITRTSSKPLLSQLQCETSFGKPVFNLTSLLFTIFHGKKMRDPKFALVVHVMQQGFSSHQC